MIGRLPAFGQRREIALQHMRGRRIGAAGKRDAARPGALAQAARSAASRPRPWRRRSDRTGACVRDGDARAGTAAAVPAEAVCAGDGAATSPSAGSAPGAGRRGGDRRRFEHVLGAGAGGHRRARRATMRPGTADRLIPSILRSTPTPRCGHIAYMRITARSSRDHGATAASAALRWSDRCGRASSPSRSRNP